jgi:hypothetical protein
VLPPEPLKPIQTCVLVIVIPEVFRSIHPVDAEVPMVEFASNAPPTGLPPLSAYNTRFTCSLLALHTLIPRLKSVPEPDGVIGNRNTWLFPTSELPLPVVPMVSVVDPPIVVVTLVEVEVAVEVDVVVELVVDVEVVVEVVVSVVDVEVVEVVEVDVVVNIPPPPAMYVRKGITPSGGTALILDQ